MLRTTKSETTWLWYFLTANAVTRKPLIARRQKRHSFFCKKWYGPSDDKTTRLTGTAAIEAIDMMNTRMYSRINAISIVVIFNERVWLSRIPVRSCLFLSMTYFMYECNGTAMSYSHHLHTGSGDRGGPNMLNVRSYVEGDNNSKVRAKAYQTNGEWNQVYPKRMHVPIPCGI